MRRLLIIAIVIGVLISGGSIGFLHFSGYNVLSSELWTLAIKGLKTQPGTMLGALGSPGQSSLMSGILGAFLGAALIGVVLFMACIAIVASTLTTCVSIVARKLRVPREVKAPKGRGENQGKRHKKSSSRLPKLSLPSFRKSGFRDEMANLDSDERGIAVAKLKEAFFGLILKLKKSKTTQVVIGSGSSKQVIAEITTDAAFYEDLKAWHQRVKKSPGSDFSLIEDARSLRKRMTKATSEKVLDQDPMGGEFMMRMVSAWAEKGAAPLPRSNRNVSPVIDEEASLMEAAISDVMANGVVHPAGDEDDFDRVDLDEGEGFLIGHLSGNRFDQDDDKDIDGPDPVALLGIDPTEDRSVDLDDDDDDDDEPLIGSGLLGESDGEDDPSGDDNVGLSVQEGLNGIEVSAAISADDFEADLKAIYELVSTLDLIEQGMGEWAEYLQSESDRVAVLERSMMAISEALEVMPSEQLEDWFEENAGAPEWEWLQENQGRLSEERRSILEMISGDADSEGGSDDDDGVDDFSVTTGSFASKGTRDLGEASSRTEGEAEGTPAETDEAVSDPELALPEVAAEPASEESLVHAEDPVDDEPRDQDLSLDELVEVEVCGDLLTKWGYSARAAGASEAKLVSPVVFKSGVKRKVVGVAHMVAGWRVEGSKESRRMNLLFRYLPEGDWTLQSDGFIRMVDARGNFVQVHEDLLEHPDLKSQTTVIHFYGPGAKEDLEGEPLDRVFVVGRVLSSDEVTEKMEG